MNNIEVVNKICQSLQQTTLTNDAQRKQGKITIGDQYYDPVSTAENFLTSLHGVPNFSLILLQIVGSNEIQIGIRLSAAIYLKNFLKSNWHITVL
jgi:hypothetical protein